MKKITIALLFAALASSVQADALRDAICNGQLDQVKKLVSAGNVNKPMENGEYPLSLASYCYGGQPAIAGYFLDRGANVNLQKEGDYPPIMWAIRSMGEGRDNPMRKVVIRMLRMGASGKGHNPSTKQSALMWAASHGDEEVVDLLIKAGGDKSLRTAPGWCTSDNTQCNAADFARIGGFVELALKLEGKDTSAYKKTLHYAAKQGDLALVQRLIKSGSDVNAQEQLSKLTPLHYAVKGGKKEIISALLAAKPDPNLENFAGITPLRDAVVAYKGDIARMLIDAGAKADHEQKQGCGGGLTEFGWAVSYSQPDVARYMIEHGALDFSNPGSSIRVLYGRDEFHLDLLKLLIAKGAKPVQEDIDTIKKIEAANAWLREKPYSQQIIAFLETTLNQPVTPPVQPEVADQTETEDSDLPTPPNLDELGAMRGRGGAPAAFKTRRLSQESPRVRSFDQKYRTGSGQLDADVLWAK